MEDKLNTAQRIRLEAVAQANALNGLQGASIEKILSDARKIEGFIRGEGESNADPTP